MRLLSLGADPNVAGNLPRILRYNLELPKRVLTPIVVAVATGQRDLVEEMARHGGVFPPEFCQGALGVARFNSVCQRHHLDTQRIDSNTTDFKILVSRWQLEFSVVASECAKNLWVDKSALLNTSKEWGKEVQNKFHLAVEILERMMQPSGSILASSGFQGIGARGVINFTRTGLASSVRSGHTSTSATQRGHIINLGLTTLNFIRLSLCTIPSLDKMATK
ncbi:hypothetical protein Pelo_16057 [Pelomyxa schiedti]|nr:hypothetical protein Pelo_16057 [Pelomyxa schiedti]